MSTSIITTIIFLVVNFAGSVLAQSSGSLWIKSFSPGSSDLNDPGIDREALAFLDSLARDENIALTFLGAADSIGWKLHGNPVHPYVSEAWNDAKRLSRARTLRARYGRGMIGVSHANLSGVQVIWAKKGGLETSYTQTLEELREEKESLNKDISKLREDVDALQFTNDGESGGAAERAPARDALTFNWRLQGGLWSWQSGTDGNLLSPSLALNIIIGRTAFVIQGGVTPWHTSGRFGNQSQSFVYAGIKYMKTERYGFALGGFRGWEFFTTTDDWSFKTTGLSAGFIVNYRFLEISPTLTYSSLNRLESASQWRLGTMIGVNININ